MPTDEHGDKWACPPCIRGHRSTKCEHFDRFMLRVKRPGRPLAQCPHAKGGCPCTTEKVMMVRIMRGTHCLCAPAPTSESSMSSTSTESTDATTPASTTSHASTGESSLPSLPASALGALEDTKNNADSPLTDDASTPASASTPTQNGTTKISRKRKVREVERAPIQPRPIAPALANPIPPALRQDSSNGASHTPRPIAEIKRRLSSSAPSPSRPRRQSSTSALTPTITEGFNNMWTAFPFNAPGMAHPNLDFDHRVEHKPTLSRPASVSYPSTGPAPSIFNAVAPADHFSFKTRNGTYPGTFKPNVPNLEEFDECTCGPGCSCLACPVHPYNSTTMDQIEDLQHILDQDFLTSEPLLIDLLPTNFLPTTDQDTFSSVSNMMPQYSMASATSAPSSIYPPSDMLNHMPDAPFSGFDFSNDYLAFEYPSASMFGRCTDTTGTCRCADSCSCIGCTYHTGHDGILPAGSGVPTSMPFDSNQLAAPTPTPTPDALRRPPMHRRASSKINNIDTASKQTPTKGSCCCK